MLQYLKLSILVILLLGLMACPAPTTVSGRISGLPDNIGDILNTGYAHFWSGRKDGASDFVTLSKEESGTRWKIKISDPSNGRQKFCEYVAEEGISGSVGSDNRWSANFRLEKCESQNKKEKQQQENENQEVLHLTMQFVSPREARVTLKRVNDVSNSSCTRYKDYDEFKMIAM